MKVTTAGESHGKGLFCIIEGLPAGLAIDMREVDEYLALRQSGYGRGAMYSMGFVSAYSSDAASRSSRKIALG